LSKLIHDFYREVKKSKYFGYFFHFQKHRPEGSNHPLGENLPHLSGADFSYIFSGENFGENSAENFPPKMLGKNGIFRGKSFEKSFFQEIPRKVIFRGKKCTKNRPLLQGPMKGVPRDCERSQIAVAGRSFHGHGQNLQQKKIEF
jgi:hypothetical protein